jgi:aminoglycoside 3-N-acetyltransferase
MSLRQTVRNLLIAVLPTVAIEQIKQARKVMRRKQWERTVQNDPDAHIDQARLERFLIDLGVEPGRDLILHSSLRKVGHVEGGAPTLIAALQNVLGPDATLLMPTYPLAKGAVEHMQDPTPFDVARDPSTMGRITNTLMAQPGALRSAHPTHSVTALGPDAVAYTADHHKTPTPCGPGSPFWRLSEKGGQILCIGIGIGKVTSHHVIEDKVEAFPIEVYFPGRLTKRVIFPDGHEETVEARAHDERWTLFRVDNDEETYGEVYRAMTAAGIVKEGMVGRAPSHLFRADDLDRVLGERLQREGTTIYRLSEVRKERGESA